MAVQTLGEPFPKAGDLPLTQIGRQSPPARAGFEGL